MPFKLTDIPVNAPWYLLYPRERRVIERRLAGDLLRQIAADERVISERIRQIERRALNVLCGRYPHHVRLHLYATNPAKLTTDP